MHTEGERPPPILSSTLDITSDAILLSSLADLLDSKTENSIIQSVLDGGTYVRLYISLTLNTRLMRYQNQCSQI